VHVGAHPPLAKVMTAGASSEGGPGPCMTPIDTCGGREAGTAGIVCPPSVSRCAPGSHSRVSEVQLPRWRRRRRCDIDSEFAQPARRTRRGSTVCRPRTSRNPGVGVLVGALFGEVALGLPFGAGVGSSSAAWSPPGRRRGDGGRSRGLGSFQRIVFHVRRDLQTP